MIYITGDCHSDFSKFETDKFPMQTEMTKDDYVIICGDFGGVFKITPEPHKHAPYTAFRILFTVCCIGSMSFSPPDTGTFCSFQSRCCLK